jgi:hypothetical protein
MLERRGVYLVTIAVEYNLLRNSFSCKEYKIKRRQDQEKNRAEDKVELNHGGIPLTQVPPTGSMSGYGRLSPHPGRS